ncbi:hypothetical protein GQ55_9G433400 [Panicum hallii var. hallii]|uniref:PRISE-like Rossmann-fold domain-containing protein n=1 Tax=Panicum hallii var. hallii TaxID=1504633 RepID=A0A2T7CB48_9POAL|nr:hypothetical protein GQ55_9G433400 [Panicum hallii var. hallii]
MSMSWWWARAVGEVSKRRGDRAAASHRSFQVQSVALVVGSTGVVGASLVDILPQPDTPGGPWKVYALSPRPPPPWYPSRSPSSVTHVHVDLTDSPTVAEAHAPLTDITHVFYVAWSSRPTDAQNREANAAMLRNVLSAVVPTCPALAHVCLQTGTKHYVGSFEAIGRVPLPDPPYTEDMPRLDCPNFYYDQDILVDAVSRRGGVSWSVHRPRLILGFAPRSAMNVVCSLCVYAAICRAEDVRAVLRWPGTRGAWEGFDNASDADLVSEQQIWAAVDPMAKNEAFNCSNGTSTRGSCCGRYSPDLLGWSGRGTRGRRTGSRSQRPWPHYKKKDISKSG